MSPANLTRFLPIVMYFCMVWGILNLFSAICFSYSLWNKDSKTLSFTSLALHFYKFYILCIYKLTFNFTESVVKEHPLRMNGKDIKLKGYGNLEINILIETRRCWDNTGNKPILYEFWSFLEDFGGLIKIPVDFWTQNTYTHFEPFEADSLLIFFHFTVRFPTDTNQHNLNVDKWNRKFKITELL